MSKPYLFLIGALVLLAAGVGIFAYTRSTTTSQQPTTYPASQPSPSQIPPPPPSEPALQSQITLTVNSPKNGQAVSTANITVSGVTVPNADVAVNDKDLKADASGKFSTSILLDEGENEIFVTASDANGNYSEWDGTVTYTPAQ
ncbi:hypothetical protein HY440_00560 [Candidatus Microgenomates bacterium]|nr:hypothetical protein [Candidatus Microgenomates bacterium]